MDNIEITPPKRGLISRPQAMPGITTALAIGLAGGGFAVPTAAQFFIAKLIVSTVISIGISAISSALTKKPKPPASSNFTQQLRDRTVTARQPIAPRRIIYGESRVGGVYTFIHTTGNANEFLSLVITISGHEINSVSGLFFDGNEVQTAFATRWGTNKYFDDTEPSFFYETGEVVFRNGTYYQRTSVPYSGGDHGQHPEDTPLLWTHVPSYTDDQLFVVDAFRDFVYMEINFGTVDQDAFSGLITEAPDKWTAKHRQRGCAGVYIRLKYNADKFPNGIPAITFGVLGKNNIFDPRTSTSGYTNNAALCTADYIALNPFGLEAAYSTEILDADLIEAANICEEQVALAGGGTENRYEANGTLETDATPFENIQSLTGAMAGAVITQGKLWTIRAGAYRAPEIPALTESEFVGPIDTQTLTTRAKSFNGVKGVFSSPDNNWQPDDFPAIQVQAYVDADNGEEVWGEITLPLTSSVAMSQRIARIMLELARRQINVVVPAMMTAYQLQPYDTVPLTIERYGWTDKTFRVENMQLVLDRTWSVRLAVQEIDANAYAWSSTDEGVYQAAPTTTLPGSFETTPPGLTVTDEVAATPTGGAVTNLIATIQPASDVFVNEFEVQFKLSTEADTEYKIMGRGSGTIYQTANVVDGNTYDVRARSISIIGVKSDFSAIRSHTIVGQTELPPDVTGFSINIVDGAANLSWLPVDVVDLSHYRIKHSSALSGATWSSAITLIDRVGKPSTSVAVPALVGTYLIKAVDFGTNGDGSNGRESQNETLIISNVEALRTFNAIESAQEEPAFNGTKTDVIVDSGELKLAYDDFFIRPDFFDPSDFFLGTSGFIDEGFYTFTDFIDLGAIFTSRVTANISATGENQSVDFFDPPDFFDPSDFFGVDDKWRAELQVRTTDDDTTGSPVWSAWGAFVTGDYSARGYDFRVKLNSDEFGVTPIVSILGINIDMPDENRAGDDLVATASGITVTFAPAYNALKGVAISAQGLATGDYYDITNKSATGFDIEFFDSSDVSIQRTFDYVAVGYGRLET
ncbi:hypothetical protein KAR91_54665 [Candidatus Pacearchaeota archaeon]|nr:hypothetical protein [Candidatus Pacearchaeota archaeon]